MKVSAMVTWLVSSVSLSLASDEITSERNVKEFCNGETFRPRCIGGRNDVIVMLTARYGRMSFGRCLKKEPEFASLMNNRRFIGCYADVKDVIDRHCSGRSECDVRINDQNFDVVKPCFSDLKMHLEASFICVKVAAESRHCTVSLTAESQHIVVGGRSHAVQSDAIGCGTESQPWTIEALAGQRVAVSLINFNSINASDLAHVSGCQPIYGYIVDKNSRRNVSICGMAPSGVEQDLQTGDAPLKTIYISTSSQLLLVAKHTLENRFIIRVEAVGCSDLAPPSDAAWLKRIGDQITIGCYMSRQSWQLNCVNGSWKGTVGICQQADNGMSVPELSQSQAARSSEYRTSTETVALVAVASGGIAVCCLVICIGVVCLRRQHQHVSKKVNSTWTADMDGVHCSNQVNTGLIINAMRCDGENLGPC